MQQSGSSDKNMGFLTQRQASDQTETPCAKKRSLETKYEPDQAQEFESSSQEIQSKDLKRKIELKLARAGAYIDIAVNKSSKYEKEIALRPFGNVLTETFAGKPIEEEPNQKQSFKSIVRQFVQELKRNNKINDGNDQLQLNKESKQSLQEFAHTSQVYYAQPNQRNFQRPLEKVSSHATNLKLAKEDEKYLQGPSEVIGQNEKNQAIKQHQKKVNSPNSGQTENLQMTEFAQINLNKLKSDILHNLNDKIQNNDMKAENLSFKSSHTSKMRVENLNTKVGYNNIQHTRIERPNNAPLQTSKQIINNEQNLTKALMNQFKPGIDSVFFRQLMKSSSTSEIMQINRDSQLNVGLVTSRQDQVQVQSSLKDTSNKNQYLQQGVKLPSIIKITPTQQLFGLLQNQLHLNSDKTDESPQFQNLNQTRPINQKLNPMDSKFQQQGIDLQTFNLACQQQIITQNKSSQNTQQFLPQSHQQPQNNTTVENQTSQVKFEFCQNRMNVMNAIENPNIISTQQMQQSNYIAKGYLPNTYPPGGLKGGSHSDDDELTSQSASKTSNKNRTNQISAQQEQKMIDESQTVTSNSNSAFIEAETITMGFASRNMINRSRSRSRSASSDQNGSINTKLNGKSNSKQQQVKHPALDNSQSSLSSSKELDCQNFGQNHHRNQSMRKRIRTKFQKVEDREKEPKKNFLSDILGFKNFKSSLQKAKPSSCNSSVSNQNKISGKDSHTLKDRYQKQNGQEVLFQRRNRFIGATDSENSFQSVKSDKSVTFCRKNVGILVNHTKSPSKTVSSISNLYTVIKMENSIYDQKDKEFRKPFEKTKTKQQQEDEVHNNFQNLDSSSNKGLSFLDQILMFKKIQTMGIFDQKLKEKELKQINGETQVSAASLYKEMNFKVATSFGHVEKIKNMVRRKQKLNYLSYNTPFNLSELLDPKYWKIKNSFLAENSTDFKKEFKDYGKTAIETFEGKPIIPFQNLTEQKNSPFCQVRSLYWQNEIDKAYPYETGFQNHLWIYIKKNVIINENIRHYLAKAKRTCFCACTDGCQNSRKCACYKFNKKLQNPTYSVQLCPTSGQTIVVQSRATAAINKIFSFNECHPMCGCNKDLCLNYLIYAENKKSFKLLVRRVTKQTNPLYAAEATQNKKLKNTELQEGALNEAMILKEGKEKESINMWGLFAMEDIPAGAFLMEYKGEIVTKKQGDMRGTFYDKNGLSYLFDMNDPLLSEERENSIQKAYFNEFFPLCLDSMFYGNEARFINHSCDPNVQSFNLTGSADSQSYHNIGLFASRLIHKGEELNLDYQWDKNELTISQNVLCLCGSYKCRGYLMRARKPKKTVPPIPKQSKEYPLTSQEEQKSSIREKFGVQIENPATRENEFEGFVTEEDPIVFSSSDSSEVDESVLISEESDLI